VKETLKEFPRKWARWRDGFRHRRTVDLTYRIVVGVVGTLVLAVGILATEFEFAQRALKWARRRYDAVMDWFGRQGLWVKALGVIFTCAVVVATLWLFGALSLVGGWVGLDWPWLKSPLGMGS
jgi:hypothetical protein